MQRTARPNLNVPRYRSIQHYVPPLKNEDKFVSEGIQKLFSPKAFDTAWTQYQRGLIQKLNDLIAGNDGRCLQK